MHLIRFERLLSLGNVTGLLTQDTSIVVPFALSVPSPTTPFEIQAWTNPSFLGIGGTSTISAALLCVADVALYYGDDFSGPAAAALAGAANSLLHELIQSQEPSNSVFLLFSFLNLANQLSANVGGPVLSDAAFWEMASDSVDLTRLFADCSVLAAFLIDDIFLEFVDSVDPNQKFGPQGVGQNAYISGQQSVPYGIYFDNQPTATAPAQTVTLTDTLDPNLNLSTLTLGPMTFPNQVVTPPAVPLSAAPFTTAVDLQPTTDLLVSVSASLNAATRLLTVNFQSLDPATNQPPTDPNAGFLPPGTGGSVFFTAVPNVGVATGTAIQNTATVVFDVNPPVNTPTWSNTVDNTPPVSLVAPLPASEASTTFPVQWSGTDISGIQSFTVYGSDNGGAFAAWQQNTTATSGTYVGQAGHTYGFYSIATDNVGNVEPAKSAAEATTMVNAAAIVPPSQVSTTASGLAYSRVTQTFNGTVAIQNIGSAAINGPLEIVFTSLTPGVTVADASGIFAGSPYITVPVSGSLAPGQSATVSVQFKNPANAAINFTPVIYSGSI
jgi:hypothetical protein